MQVNLNLLTQSLTVNSTSASGSQSSSASSQSALLARKDSVTISPAGKANSQIEALMKQKQSIVRSKNELISKAIDEGKSLQDIQTQLSAYEQQLKSIDNQIAQIMADLARQQGQKSVSSNKEPESKEETETELLGKVASLSADLERAQKVYSTKEKVDGEIRVTKREIATDRATGGVIASKEEHLAQLEQRSASLSAQMGEGLGKLHQEIDKTAADQTGSEDGEGRTEVEPEVQE